MADGHIEVTVSVCVCVFQIRVRPITSLFMVGFTNHLAQMIIKTRQCVSHKNHVARSKVKVTVGTSGFYASNFGEVEGGKLVWACPSVCLSVTLFGSLETQEPLMLESVNYKCGMYMKK